MALGKQQRETLTKLVDLGTKPMKTGYIRFVVKIGKERPYTREFGRGMAITITPYECYIEGDYPMLSHWIANCTHDYTAVEKGQEIARYLVEHGIAREKVRLVR